MAAATPKVNTYNGGAEGTLMWIWIVQLIVSPIWLQRFRFGPAEWLWRTLTYGRVQPIRQAPTFAPLVP